MFVASEPALTEGYVGSLHENRHGSSVQIRRRKASGDPYWAYSVGYSVDNDTCQFSITPGCVLLRRPGTQPDQVLIEEILVAVETSSSCGRCVNSLAVVKLLSYQEAFPEVIPAPSSCPQQTGLCWPLC
ncbi:Receptor-type tyrosine-protein phosphatase gamma [Anas platyrhynchos]|uniref:Receptor-type tyrosine-protein phosphatase gamma n=1 Tax=Anas platyrhynchos TaxID=8839 RepID=R0M3P6_ANAPL|nr:Receptor-type tyrosine-protein phosphatase gamma [Anas platyrhynchos]